MVLCVPIVKSRRSNRTRLFYSHLYGVYHHRSIGEHITSSLSLSPSWDPCIVLSLSFLRVVDIRYNLVKSTFNPFLFLRVRSLPSPRATDCRHRTRLTELFSFYFLLFSFLFSSVLFFLLCEYMS